jgi:hypothetical protein
VIVHAVQRESGEDETLVNQRLDGVAMRGQNPVKGRVFGAQVWQNEYVDGRGRG